MAFGCGTGFSGEHDGAEMVAGLKNSSKGSQTLLPPTTDVPHCSGRHQCPTQPVQQHNNFKSFLQYFLGNFCDAPQNSDQTDAHKEKEQ